MVTYDREKDGLYINGVFYTREHILTDRNLQDTVAKDSNGRHVLKEWVAYANFKSQRRSVVWPPVLTDLTYNEDETYNEDDLVPNPK